MPRQHIGPSLRPSSIPPGETHKKKRSYTKVGATRLHGGALTQNLSLLIILLKSE